MALYIQIPKMIDDRIVSELADHCFSTRNNHLEDTLICNSDENLYELNKENIEYIDIPDTVTKLGSFCFYNCKKLKEIHLSNTHSVNICLYYISNFIYRRIIEYQDLFKTRIQYMSDLENQH